MEGDEVTGRPTAGEARALASERRGTQVVTAAMARRVLRTEGGSLWADFPNQNGDRSKGPVPLSMLNGLDPLLRQALAEGYAMHCLKNVRSADRRYDFTSRLRTGFIAYLDDPDVATTTLGDVDEDFLHGFKAWLDTEDRPGFLPLRQSRAEQLLAVQAPLKQLLGSREWKPRLSPKLRLIKRPYPKLVHDVEHTPTLTEPQYEQLYAGAALEIERIVRQREAQLRAMDLYGTGVTLAEAGSSPEACAAYLNANFPHPVPSYYEQGRTSAAYTRLITEAVQAEAERILYPNLDEIVPMVLVVCTFFALNPSVIFKLRRGGPDYTIFDVGHIRRLRMHPMKRRASLRQRNVVTITDHPDNPGRIIEFVEKRTRLLGQMRPEVAKRLFLRFGDRKRTVSTFDVSDDQWRAALDRFAAKIGIPTFRLEQLRPTTLDLVHELSGGNIIAMQGVATHTSAQTTYTFYTSDAQRRRNRERLGEALMQMERWAVTGGKIRPEDRPPGIAEHAAATPGFSCLDPKDSPLDGEVPGELCTAYGRCPECPLALVDPTSARSLAYLTMLNKRITEAADDLVDPLGWHMRWATVQDKLITYWLRGWPDDLVAKAKTIPIPDLPPVE